MERQRSKLARYLKPDSKLRRPVGNPNFYKGMPSNNPSGTSSDIQLANRVINEICAEASPDIVRAIIKAATDPKEPPAIRHASRIWVAEKAGGKAAVFQHIEVSRPEPLVVVPINGLLNKPDIEIADFSRDKTQHTRDQ